MNDPLGGQNFQTSGNEAPASPPSSGWAPAPAEPAPVPVPPVDSSNLGAPAPMGSNPFETAQTPIPPVSGPTSPMGDDQGMMESGPHKSNLKLIIILAVLIILGGLFFAVWIGWIKIGFLNNLFGTKTTTTTTTTPPVNTANVNDTKRKEDLANLKTALKKYYTANQKYPLSTATEKTSDPVSLKVLVPDYIAALPVDPLSPTYYYGYKSPDGKTFEITAILEDKTDPTGITVGTNFIYKVTDSSVETPTTSGTTTTTQPAAVPTTTQ